MSYKKFKADKHIKQVAKGKGITEEECRYEMEKAIKAASVKPSNLFTKAFGNRTPSLEEFICKLLDMIDEEEMKRIHKYDA